MNHEKSAEDCIHEVLDLLSSVYSSFGLDEAAKRVESLKDNSLPIIIDKLSLMERTAGPAELMRTIAMAKQALTGKAERGPFLEHCLRLSGLR